MIIPVRCFSCGKVLADKWEMYESLSREKDRDLGKILDRLGITRICCRTVMLTHVDMSLII